MQVHDRYPVGAATGSCIVTKEYRAGGVHGQVVDLDVDLEFLPTHGKLCVSEKAVKLMCTALGLKVMPKDESRSVIGEQADEIKRLSSRIDELETALRNVVAAGQLVDVEVDA